MHACVNRRIDLLQVPGKDFYGYGLKLRAIAKDKRLMSIKFLRLSDVLGIADGNKLSEQEYLALVPYLREEMLARHLPDGFNVKAKIAEDKDTNMTYQSYLKIVQDDLHWGPDLQDEIKNNPAKYEEEVGRVAEGMITRLLVSETKAATNGIKLTFPLLFLGI